MYTIVQFSPTGNAAHVADLLAKELQVKKTYALEHTDSALLENSKHLIIVYAIHAFSAPKTVKRFVKNLSKDKFEHISLIGVGCNTSWVNDAASKDIRKQLLSKSYEISLDIIVAMPLTLVTSFPLELIEEQLNEINNSINQIANDIKSASITERIIKTKSKVIHSLGYLEPFAARFFGLELHAKKTCNKCGLCVRECPEKNIRFNKNKKIKIGMKCIMCMRCIYNCPQKSITPRIAKFVPIKGGYNIQKYIK